MQSASKPSDLNIISALNILLTLEHTIATKEIKDNEIMKEVDLAITTLSPFPKIQEFIRAKKVSSKKAFLSELHNKISTIKRENAYEIANIRKHDVKNKTFIDFYYNSIQILGSLIQEIQTECRFEHTEQSSVWQLLAQEKHTYFKKTIVQTIRKLHHTLEKMVDELSDDKPVFVYISQEDMLQKSYVPLSKETFDAWYDLISKDFNEKISKDFSLPAMLNTLLKLHKEFAETAKRQLDQYDKDIQDLFSTIQPIMDSPPFSEAKPLQSNDSEKIIAIKEGQITEWDKEIKTVIGKGLCPSLKFIKDEKQLPSEPALPFSFYLLKKQSDWMVYFVNKDLQLNSTEAKEIPGLCDLLPSSPLGETEEQDNRNVINRLSIFFMELLPKQNKYEILTDKMARMLLNSFLMYLKTPVDTTKLFIIASLASDYLNVALFPEEAKENESLRFFNNIRTNLALNSPGLNNPDYLSNCLHEVEYYDLVNLLKPLIENMMLPNILEERAKMFVAKKNPIEECNTINKEIPMLMEMASTISKKNIFKRKILKERVERSNRHPAPIEAKIVFASIQEAKSVQESLQKFIDILLEKIKFAELAKNKHFAALKHTFEGQKALNDVEKKLNNLQRLLSQFNHELLLIKQNIAEYEVTLQKVTEDIAKHQDSMDSLESERKALEINEDDLRKQAIEEQREYEKLASSQSEPIKKANDHKLQITVEGVAATKQKLRRVCFFQQEIKQWQDAKQNGIHHNQIIIDAWVAQHFASLMELYDNHAKSKKPEDPKMVAIAMLCNAMVEGSPHHKASRSPKTHCDVDTISAAIETASKKLPEPTYAPLVRIVSNSSIEEHHPTRSFIKNLKQSFSQMFKTFSPVTEVDQSQDSLRSVTP